VRIIERVDRIAFLCLLAFSNIFSSPVKAELIQAEREYDPFHFRSDIVEFSVLTLLPYDYATGANLDGQRQVELHFICAPAANDRINVNVMITSYSSEDIYNQNSEWYIGFRGVATGKGFFKIGTAVGATAEEANVTFQVYRSEAMVSDLGRYFDEFHIRDLSTVYLSTSLETDFLPSILDKGQIVIFSKNSDEGRFLIQSELLYKLDDSERKEFATRCNEETP
jgi:hypothetical protein